MPSQPQTTTNTCLCENGVDVNVDHQKRDPNIEKYKHHPLARDLLFHQATRNEALRRNVHKHNQVPSRSNWYWVHSIFLFQARAVDVYALPWFLVTINAAVWTLLADQVDEVSDFNINSVEVNLLVSACLATPSC